MTAGMRRKRRRRTRRRRRRRGNRWRRMPTTTNEELLDEGGAVRALVSHRTWVQEPIADGTWSDIGCEKMEGWGLGL